MRKEMDIIIGSYKTQYMKKSKRVYLTIEETDEGFNISAYIAKNRFLGCSYAGQIIDELKSDDFKLKPTIRKADFNHIIEYWEKYHLNGIRPDCIHQADILEKYAYERNKENLIRYLANYKTTTYNFPIWKCPICGYMYGSAWKTHIVPSSELKFMREFINKYGGV